MNLVIGILTLILAFPTFSYALLKMTATINTNPQYSLTYPYSLESNPVTGKIYVGGANNAKYDESIIRIDAESGQADGAIKGTKYVPVFAIDTTANKLYTVRDYYIDIFDLSGNTLIESIKADTYLGYPRQILPDFEGKKLFICYWDKIILADLNSKTFSILFSISSSYYSYYYEYFDSIAFDKDNNKLYVSVISYTYNQNYIYTYKRLLKKYDVSQKIQSGTIEISTNSWFTGGKIAFSQSENKIFFQDYGKILKVDPDTGAKSQILDNMINYPQEMLIDDAAKKLYVCDPYYDKLYFVDMVTNQIEGSVILDYPNNLRINKTKNQIYALSYPYNKPALTIIDIASKSISKTINIGQTHPWAVDFDASQKMAYVADRSGSNIFSIDTTNDTLSEKIQTNGKQWGDIAVHSGLKKAFLVDDYGRNVTIFDLQSKNVLNQIFPTGPPTSVAVDEPSNKVYAPYLPYYDPLLVIDANTNAKINSIQMGTRDWPSDVAVNPLTKRAYVTDYSNSKISVIDTEKNIIISTISCLNYPKAVAVNKKTNTIYVASQYYYYDYVTSQYYSYITAIDGATNNVVTNIKVDNYPYDITVNEDGNRIYVLDQYGTNVTVINGINNKVCGSLYLGGYASRLKVLPGTNKIYIPLSYSGKILVVEDDFTDDTTPPEITHTPVADNQPDNQYLKITANITDNVKMIKAILAYREAGTSKYNYITMTNLYGTTTYYAYIWTYWLQNLKNKKIEYYIDAIDDSGNWPPTGSTPGTEQNPNSFTVKDVTPPYPVYNLSGTAESDNRAKLSWYRSWSADAEKYNIYWDNGTGTIDYSKPLAVVTHSSGTYNYNFLTDPLTRLKEYKFAVRVQDTSSLEEKNTYVVTILILPVGESVNGTLNRLWTQRFGSVCGGYYRMIPGPSAAIADLKPDLPGLEIATGNEEYYPLNNSVMGRWFLFGSNGSTLWWKDTENDEAHSSVVIDDVNGDGKLEMGGGTTSGNQVQVFDANANWVWRYIVGSHVLSTPAMAQLDKNTSHLEVAAGCFDRYVRCFDGKDGTLKWRYLTDSWIWSSAAVEDLDNDGTNEVVIGSNYGYLYCLDGSTGSLKWKYSVGYDLRASAALSDVDKDGKKEVIVPGQYKILCLNGTDGTLKWQASNGSYYNYSSPAVADLDADGSLEIIYGSGDGNVYCLNGKDGSLKWKTELYSPLYSSPAIAKRKKDSNILDVYIVTNSGLLCTLRGTDGAVLDKFKAAYNVVSSPVVGDVDGDGKLEIFFQDQYATINGNTGDYFWSVRDITSDVEPYSVEWAMFRANSAHTGEYQRKVAESAKDITPPAKVQKIDATLKSPGNVVSLSWSANTEEDLAGYRIYQNEVLSATSTQSGYLITGLDLNTSYYYDVSALDKAGNEGPKSDKTVSYTRDMVSPAKVSGLTISRVAEGGSLNLAWTANTEPDLAGYIVYRNSTKLTNVKDTAYTDNGLTNGVTYSYKISAYDTGGNEGMKSGESSEYSWESIPPAKVSNPALTLKSSGNVIQLVWTGNTESDLAGYRIYRNGGLIAAATQSIFADNGLVFNTTYSYRISAFDIYGNEGEKSDIVSGYTRDLIPPAKPSGLVLNLRIPGDRIQLNWFANTEPDLAGYRIYINDTLALSTTRTAYLYTGLTFNITYYFAVSAFDKLGNEGQKTDKAECFTRDMEPPFMVAGLSVKRAVEGEKLNLSWTANTEPDLAGYRVYRDGKKIADVNTASYADTGLTNGVIYTYSVSAYDTSGNEGMKSGESSEYPWESIPPAKVSNPDLTPPAKVLKLTSEIKYPGSAILLAWAPNTENDLAGYRIYQSDTLIAVTTGVSYLLTGLVVDAAYYFSVSAFDAAGNEGEKSDKTMSFTKDILPPSKVSGLTVVRAAEGGKLNLSWTPNTEIDLSGYRVYRNGQKINKVTGASYIDSGLTNGVTYSYNISAYDKNSNEGPKSDAVSEFTWDSIPPSKVNNVSVEIKYVENLFKITWTANTEPDIAGYRLYKDGQLIAELSAASYNDSALIAGVTYQYRVSAFDIYGNEGEKSQPVSGILASKDGAARASIKIPKDGQAIKGNAVTIMAEATDNTSGVQFRYRKKSANEWVNISDRDNKKPFAVYWNTSGIDNGDYELNAVAWDGTGMPDIDPGVINVTVADVNTDIVEDGNTNVDPNQPHKKEEKVKPDENKEVAMADGTSAKIPSGTVNSSTKISIESVVNCPPLPVQQSILKPAGIFRKFEFADGQRSFNNLITITLPYPDENNDGIVDGTSINAGELRVHYYDETSGNWVEAAPESESIKSVSASAQRSAFFVAQNAKEKTLTVQVNHFTVFGLFYHLTPSNIDNLIIYPNPCKTFLGDKGIVFEGLPAGVQMGIYTITGKPVRTLSAGGSGMLTWDIRNTEGEEVSSGVYIYLIKTEDGRKKTGKVAVLR